MTVQWSDPVRNGVLNGWSSSIGSSPVFCIYSGAMPASASSPSNGIELAEFQLASTWATSASAGSIGLANLPMSTTGKLGAGTGTRAGYYRIYSAGKVTCHEQGRVSATGGSGDLILDNTSIATNQAVNIVTFTKTAPGQ